MALMASNGGGGALYDSANLRFTPSVYDGTSYSTGIDDFCSFTPFKQRICALKYDSTLDKQVVVGYKGDSNWDDLNADPDINIMVEFPKFWFARPSSHEFLVSDKAIDGFMVSPMHDRGSVIHENAYVSKYVLNYSTDRSTFHSQTGKRPAPLYYGESVINQKVWSNKSVLKIQNYRDKLRPYKLYVFDYVTYTMILILCMIKTQNVDVQHSIGYGVGNIGSSANDGSGMHSNGGTDNCPTLDGGSTSSELYDVCSLGIENLWRNIWLILDGIFMYKNYLYINPDIEQISAWPSTPSEWIQENMIPLVSNDLYTTEYKYSTKIPSSLWPITGSTSLADARFPNLSNLSAISSSSTTYYWIGTGGRAYNVSIGTGPYTFHTGANSIDTDAWYYANRAVTFID